MKYRLNVLSCVLFGVVEITALANTENAILREKTQIYDPKVEVTVLEGFDWDRISFENNSDFNLRFKVEGGFALKIPAGENFSVPCEGYVSNGFMELVMAETSTAIDSYPLCGDLVKLNNY